MGEFELSGITHEALRHTHLYALDTNGLCDELNCANTDIQILFVINQPEVWKSPTSNTYM
jgi:hypothetical protein